MKFQNISRGGAENAEEKIMIVNRLFRINLSDLCASARGN